MIAIIIDIDHCLADAAHRDTLLDNWDAYHAASWQDAPVKSMVTLVNTLSAADFYIVAITGRPEKWRQLTMTWLLKHNVQIDELLMRPNKNFKPSSVLKVELALARFTAMDNVLFVIDDREDVVAAFKALGVTALQVRICGS